MGTMISTPTLQMTTLRSWGVVYAAQGHTESEWSPGPQHSDLGDRVQFSRHMGPSCLGPFWAVGASAQSCCVSINTSSGPFLRTPPQGASPDLPPLPPPTVSSGL